jgi:16S rRNA (uracil1498-N3)-methyltransferase
MRVVIQRGSGKAGKRVSLDESETHHLRVRRARVGEPVEILDGAGLNATGRLVQTDRKWLVEIGTADQEPPPPELVLAIGAGDRERFFWLVEKSVELGVTEIIPLETAHTAGVSSRIKQNHLARLRRSSLEALKQCGSRWVPAIDELVSLHTFLQRPRSGLGWLAEISGTAPPSELDSQPLTILVGPEGGFTEDERKAIVDVGYQSVTFGAHTLRFETAAIAAAAAAGQARLRGVHG